MLIFGRSNCIVTASGIVTLHSVHQLRADCSPLSTGIAHAERDGTRAETRFRLSPKRTSPCKSVGASVQSTVGSRGVCISLSNAG